jgi:hypothetical protein
MNTTPDLNRIGFQHAGVPLPSPLNPGVLSAQVKELAAKKEKLEAMALHCLATGAGFAEPCELINSYLHENRGFHLGERASM